MTLACLGSTDRSFLLYYDGDSLLFALVRSSIVVGQPQGWVLTSPLFLLETAVYVPLGALGLPVRAALGLDGVVNWLLYYAALRVVAGAVRASRGTGVAAAVLGVAAITACAVTETSSDRNALEPASLLVTTTYYSGTVIGVLVACAALAAHLRPTRAGWRPAAALALTAAFSTMSNPLFLAWGVVPLGAVALLAPLVGARWRASWAALGLLALAAAAGLFARIPFAAILVQDGAGKIRPDLAVDSAKYYAGLLADRLAGAPGRIELVLVGVLLAGAAVGLLACIRARWVAGAVLCGIAVIGPIAVATGSVALGTFASRYLEPVVFLPTIAVAPLCVLLAPVARPLLARRGRLVALLGVPVVACAAAVALPVAVSSPGATRWAASVRCVDGWIVAHGGTGAGQYWSVRAPKAYLPDPRLLVQTDQALLGYSWLTNTDDFTRTTASYLVGDAESVAFDPPPGVQPTGTVDCGAWTITTYPRDSLRIGPAHH